MDKKINKIALSFAMIDEAQPLIQRLSLSESSEYSKEISPFMVYKNESDSIFLIANGRCPQYECDRIGTQWSTLSTYLTLSNLSPDIMINAGTCGGVLSDEADRSSMNIADVYIGESVIYSDRRVPIKPWKGWDIGQYPLFGAAYLNERIEKLKIAKCIATSNSFDCTACDEEIYREYGVMCKEMECAAVAEMCQYFDSQLIALKAVTDLVKYHDADGFVENFGKTVDALTDVTEMVIREIYGKSLAAIHDQ